MYSGAQEDKILHHLQGVIADGYAGDAADFFDHNVSFLGFLSVQTHRMRKESDQRLVVRPPESGQPG